MTIKIQFCPICQQETEFQWICDADSEPDEPQFKLVCTICGVEDDDKDESNELKGGVDK